MPSTISLSTYTIRIYSTDLGGYVNLDNPLDGHLDSCDFLNQYISELNRKISHDHLQQKLLRVMQFNKNGRQISGIIETGDYGYESDLFNVQTSLLSYQRQSHEAELLPFYFLIILPRDINLGIVILQRFGQRGIKTILSIDLSNYFSAQLQNYRVEIDTLVPNMLLNDLLQRGEIKSVRFTRYRIPSDLADQFDHSFEEDQGIAEFIIKTKGYARIPLINRVREYIFSNRPIEDFISFPEFDYNNVKIQFVIDGQTRTIDLEDPRRIRAYYDVTDRVQIGLSGHPTFESIDIEARNLARDILRGLGQEDYDVYQN